MDAAVARQIDRLSERLAAHSARVRPLLRVRQHVLVAVSGHRERLPAHRTGERPLAGVRARVLREVRRLRERLLADVAAVRPLAGVDARVLRQRAGAQEHLAARLAHVHDGRAARHPPLLLRRAHRQPRRRRRPQVRRHVQPRVLPQRAALPEPLAALATRERPLVAVDAHVLRERRPLDERLVAHAARVRPLAGVHAFVLLQLVLLRAALVAEAARVRPVAGVHALVPLQVARGREATVAQAALERLLAGVRTQVVAQRRPARVLPPAVLARLRRLAARAPPGHRAARVLRAARVQQPAACAHEQVVARVLPDHLPVFQLRQVPRHRLLLLPLPRVRLQVAAEVERPDECLPADGARVRRPVGAGRRLRRVPLGVVAVVRRQLDALVLNQTDVHHRPITVLRLQHQHVVAVLYRRRICNIIIIIKKCCLKYYIFI